MTAPSRHKLAVHVVPLQKNTETKQPTVEKATVEAEPTVEVTVEEPTVEKVTVEAEPTVEVTVEEPTVEMVTVEEATPDRATMALGESADRGKASVEKAQEATEGEGKPVEMEETDSVIEALVVKVSVALHHQLHPYCIMHSCLLLYRNTQVLLPIASFHTSCSLKLSQTSSASRIVCYCIPWLGLAYKLLCLSDSPSFPKRCRMEDEVSNVLLYNNNCRYL